MTPKAIVKDFQVGKESKPGLFMRLVECVPFTFGLDPFLLSQRTWKLNTPMVKYATLE
jgi:hypothetical protein